MRVGLFGFPKVGKSTLFNTLTGLSVSTDAFATKPQTHVGMARVPDDRLGNLSTMFRPKKTTQATVEYVDILGVTKDDSQGRETLLNELKSADALMHVVRAFEDPNLPHSQGSIHPKRDVENMELELILTDLMVVNRRIERLEAMVQKINRPQDAKELALLQKCAAALEKEVPFREMEFSNEDEKHIRGFSFLSAKPLLVVLNLSETEVEKMDTAVKDADLLDFSARAQVSVVAVSAKIEMEIARLKDQDRKEFMRALGISESCLDRLIRTSYKLLGLISFFTVGEDECRAWTIPHGTIAQKAAGTIHSDIERGFIRSEVIGHQDLLAAGSWNAAKSVGKIRLEGKEYVVQNGDIVHVRFNV